MISDHHKTLSLVNMSKLKPLPTVRWKKEQRDEPYLLQDRWTSEDTNDYSQFL